MPKKTPLLQKVFPILGPGVNSRSFKITAGLVLAGSVGLLAAGVLTGDAMYFQLMGSLLASALLGQIAPFYPVGVVSLFVFLMLVVTAHHPQPNSAPVINPTVVVQPGVMAPAAPSN